MPPVTTALIVANVALFLLQSVSTRPCRPFALWPLATASLGQGVSFMPWQVVTYAFLHGSLLHLAFNMFALYMFGGAIERVFGPRRYALFYFVSVISAAATQLIVAALSGGIYPTSVRPVAYSACCSRTACISRTTA
jgi:membrane associated rhomboid family serine protease